MNTLAVLTQASKLKGPLKMTHPNVVNELNDPTNKVRYRVMAYRALTREELLQSVAMHLRKQKGKKTKPGTLVTIITVIGHSGT